MQMHKNFQLDKSCIECGECSETNFWDVSRVLLDEIEGPSYVESKEKHNAYLIENPYVARKRNIDTYRSLIHF